MHSRIFKFIPLDEYQDEVDYFSHPDYDTNYYFADYVDEDTDLDDDFKWLIDFLRLKREDLIKFDYNNHTFKILEGFKQKYFKENFEYIVKAINSNMAFEIFCGELKSSQFNIHALKRNIEEEFEFYMEDTDGCYETIDSFIRNMEYNKEYKILQSLDYHF